jgi:hypothetical protein
MKFSSRPFPVLSAILIRTIEEQIKDLPNARNIDVEFFDVSDQLGQQGFGFHPGQETLNVTALHENHLYQAEVSFMLHTFAPGVVALNLAPTEDEKIDSLNTCGLQLMRTPLAVQNPENPELPKNLDELRVVKNALGFGRGGSVMPSYSTLRSQYVRSLGRAEDALEKKREFIRQLATSIIEFFDKLSPGAMPEFNNWKNNGAGMETGNPMFAGGGAGSGGAYVSPGYGGNGYSLGGQVPRQLPPGVAAMGGGGGGRWGN